MTVRVPAQNPNDLSQVISSAFSETRLTSAEGESSPTTGIDWHSGKSEQCGLPTPDLSSPGPGRTMLANTEPWGAPFRQAVELLASDASPNVVGLLTSLYSEVNPLPEGYCVGDEPALHAVYALCCMWILGQSLGVLGPNSNLRDAEIWFTGNGSGVNAIPEDTLSVATAILQGAGQPSSLGPILPYVFDMYAPGTRRAVLSNATSQSSRSHRKAHGVFYTPGDVARFMVDSAIEQWHDSGIPKVLDPACGSGVFLRAAFHRLVKNGWQASDVIDYLFGVDISMTAVESCAFVITHDALTVDNSLNPLTTWKRVRRNLVCDDSLLIPTPNEQTGLFSELQHISKLPERQFDVIVANPPYAQLDNSIDILDLERRFHVLSGVVTPATGRFIPFLEFMWTLTSDSGVASMLVPLSISYGSQRSLVRVRECMQRQHGRWSFLFFDRTPDAIFGDDVKQRVAIVQLEKSQEDSLFTSGTLRWTSRTRQGIFSRERLVKLSGKITDVLPKAGTPEQVTAYQALRSLNHYFSEDWMQTKRVPIAEASRSATTVLTAGTAYNWLSVFRDVTLAQESLVSPTANPLFAMEFSTEELADFAYGLLCSRVVYWLWRVESDCFHVPRVFLERLPLSSSVFPTLAKRAIADAGRRLWASVSQTPVVSVNRGRQTIGYCPQGQSDLLDEIDMQLITSIGLPASTIDWLRDFVYENAVVDQVDAARVSVRARSLIAWRS